MENLHWDYSWLTATKKTITARIAQFNESGAQVIEAEELTIGVDLTKSYHEQVIQALSKR